MNEIIAVPLIKIIMFLAALYAPGNTVEIQIHHGNEIEEYVKDGGLWTSKNDPDDSFMVQGYRLLTPSGFINLKTELNGMPEHDWTTESVLKVGANIEVLKTKEGLLIFPDGIRGADEPITVIYKTKSRRVRKTQNEK